VSGKVIVCRCEDVTLADVEHSIELGYIDIEEVKRYTGFGTGPCQGKECMSLIARIVAERTGAPAASVPPFTARQPLAPTPLRLFARDPAGQDGEESGKG
jgi:NAD(P)H-nitrite reductase large subunit